MVKSTEFLNLDSNSWESGKGQHHSSFFIILHNSS
jgi:hypothetical protein